MPSYVLVSAVKGGVGKSIISFNLAYYLSQRGYRVGIVDADLESSWLPVILRGDDYEKPRIGVNKIEPGKWRDLEIFSIGFLYNRAVTIEGDLEVQIVHDALTSVEWSSDIVVVDMPAGLGDIYLGVLEAVDGKTYGTLLVALPSTLPSFHRALDAAKRYGLPVIGAVLNMAYLDVDCGECGEKRVSVFGDLEQAVREIESTGVEVLATIPIIPEVNNSSPPLIPEQYMVPVVERVARLLAESSPVALNLGEVYEEDSRIKRVVVKVLVMVLSVANRKIDLREAARKYNAPGNRPIELVFYDKSFTRPIGKICVVFLPSKGKIAVVRGRCRPEILVAMPYNVFAEILLGETSLKDALFSSRIKVMGRGSLALALFLSDVLTNPEIRALVKKLEPVLKKLL